MAYVTADELIDYTGVDASSLGIEDLTALRARLDSWIAQAQEMVEKFIGYAYTDIETVPLGVANATLRVAANIVAQAQIRRQTQILNIDEYSQRMVPDSVFTRAIRADLEPYVIKESQSLGNVRRGTIGTSTQWTGETTPTFIELSVEEVNRRYPISQAQKNKAPNAWDIPND